MSALIIIIAILLDLIDGGKHLNDIVISTENIDLGFLVGIEPPFRIYHVLEPISSRVDL